MAESLQLGLCGLPVWHVDAGVLTKIELFTIKRRRVARAVTVRLSGIARRFTAYSASPQSGRKIVAHGASHGKIGPTPPKPRRGERNHDQM